jgi:8-oxo-dGTP pyrophosphatase MutT (NUDIX family)
MEPELAAVRPRELDVDPHVFRGGFLAGVLAFVAFVGVFKDVYALVDPGRRGELAWGLAKGGIEAGESSEEAAVREVREETGIEAEIEASLGETRYFYVWEDVRIRKTVHFFLMRATGGEPSDRDDEMEDVQWFPLERALKRAAYRGEREVLGRAAEILR